MLSPWGVLAVLSFSLVVILIGFAIQNRARARLARRAAKIESELPPFGDDLDRAIAQAEREQQEKQS